MENKMTIFAKRVKLLMKEKNLTQKKLSELSGVSEPSLCRYLNDKESRFDVVMNTAKALGVSTNYLLGKEEHIEIIFDSIKDIQGIYDVSYISNVMDRSNRYVLTIKIRMELDSLPLYDESIVNKLWKEKFSPYIESKAIFDYEV